MRGLEGFERVDDIVVAQDAFALAIAMKCVGVVVDVEAEGRAERVNQAGSFARRGWDSGSRGAGGFVFASRPSYWGLDDDCHCVRAFG